MAWGLSPESIERLRAHLTILPDVSKLNVNTASAEVLAATFETMGLRNAIAYGAEMIRSGRADIVVAAVGKRDVLTADMVKPGAVVLDVGMNRNDEGKLCGDVDFAGVREVASHITPVPGGVGPMTITMLLVNTLEAAEAAAH